MLCLLRHGLLNALGGTFAGPVRNHLLNALGGTFAVSIRQHCEMSWKVRLLYDFRHDIVKAMAGTISVPALVIVFL